MVTGTAGTAHSATSTMASARSHLMMMMTGRRCTMEWTLMANSNYSDYIFCDGDYNKPVPAQFTEDFNHPVHCQKTEFLTRGDFLCPSCQRNQLLKIKQLATFEPLNEATYDEEIDFYKRHLEKVYALCPTCDAYVKRELEQLDKSFNQQQQDASRDASFPSISDDKDESSRPSSIRASRVVGWLPPAVALGTSLCSVLLLAMGAHSCCLGLAQQTGDDDEAANLHQHDHHHHHHHYLYSSEGLLGWLGMVVGSVDRLSVALCGLLLCLCSKMLHGKYRVHLCDAVHVLLWVVVVGVGTWLPPVSSPHLLPLLCHLATPAIMLSLELFLACRHRPLSTASAQVIRRLSLDAAGFGACSDAASDAVSSVSTSCRRRVPSPFSDSGDGPSLLSFATPTTQPMSTDSNALPHTQLLTTDSNILGSMPETRTRVATKKDGDLDTLGKSLGAFFIGSLANDSGYSSGRSSVFSSCSFGPVSAVSSAIPRPSTPRPLISPAKLSILSSQPAMTSCTWSGSRGMFGGVGVKEGRSPGQTNLFLAGKTRPRSMFDHGSPVNTPATINHLFASSRQQTRSGSRSLVVSLDDLKSAHLSLPRTRSQTKAASELAFPLPGVRRRGSTVSEVDFPLWGARKTGHARSEVDSHVPGARKTSRTINRDSLHAPGVGTNGMTRMSGVEHPFLGGHERRQTVGGGVEWHGAKLPGSKPTSSVGLLQAGMASPHTFSSPLTTTTWWRHSTSDLRQAVDDQEQVTFSQPHLQSDEHHLERDKDTAMERVQPSERSMSLLSLPSPSLPVECDSTTPLLSQLNISPPSSKKKKRRRKKALKEVAANSVFLLSDDEDEGEEEGEGLFDRTNQSTVSTVILQSKSEWGLLQWAVVAVLVFSVCTNLILSWTVWAARH